MKRVGGFRRKSRQKLKKPLKDKGKLYIYKYLQNFEEGDKVILKMEPSFHKGVFNLRFYGKTGEVVGKQGEVYKVKVKDGKKEKICLVNPVHLVKA